LKVGEVILRSDSDTNIQVEAVEEAAIDLRVYGETQEIYAGP
jgi:hypothetical protein